MDDRLINREIKSNIIRLKDNKNLISKIEAINQAQAQGLDLIELSTYELQGQSVSVCIIQDYQKFQYRQKQRLKEISKKQTKIEIKEIQFGPSISNHDLDVKCNYARKFLEKKNKVKIVVKFKGRELTYKDNGEILLLSMYEKLSDISKIENMPKLIGNNMTMMLLPK